jgi:hypothetical protein
MTRAALACTRAAVALILVVLALALPPKGQHRRSAGERPAGPAHAPEPEPEPDETTDPSETLQDEGPLVPWYVVLDESRAWLERWQAERQPSGLTA